MAEKRRGGTIIFAMKRRFSDDAVLIDVAKYSTFMGTPLTKGGLFELFDPQARNHDGAVILSLFCQRTREVSPTIWSAANKLPVDPELSSTAVAEVFYSTPYRMEYFSEIEPTLKTEPSREGSS